jgi:iron complex outermembrane recepter protein
MTLGLSAGWNDLEVTDEDAGAGLLLFPNGYRLNNSPEFTGSVTADYEFPLGIAGAVGRLSMALFHNTQMDRREVIGGNVVATESDEIWNGRLSTGVELPSGFGASLYITNITSEDGATAPRVVSSAFQAPRLRPRTVGIQFKYDY